MTNNNMTGTLSLTEVNTYAADIEGIIRARKVPTLTIAQMNKTIANYLDIPTINTTDIMRIRVRTASLIDDLLTRA